MNKHNDKKQPLSILAAWRSAYRLLNSVQKNQIIRWLGVSLTGRAIQAFSVISVMPFVALITTPELINTHEVLIRAFELSGAAGYKEFLTLVGLFTIGLYLLTASFTCFEVWYGARLSNELGHSFSTRLFSIYIRQDYARHLKTNQASALTLITEEAEETMVGVLITGIEILSNGFLALLITSMLMIVSIKAALISALVLGVAYTLIHCFFSKRIEKHGEEVHDLGVELMKTVQETLTGIRDIKTYRAEESFCHRHSTLSRKITDRSTAYALLEFAPRQLLEATVFSGIVTFALVSMLIYPDPGQVMPMIALYAMAAYRLIPTLREIHADMESINYTKFMVVRLQQEFALEQAKGQCSSPPLNLDKGPLVQFSNVGFTYPGESLPVLNNFHWEIKKHSRTALIGPSGAGKSTVIDILTGLLQASEGELHIAGTLMNKSNMPSWQKHISYISQSIYLFEGSLAQNIAMESDVKKIDLKRVKEACEQAELGTYVDSLEDGYNTALGTGQRLLSGGQLRRLGIARALYPKPELLILDESLNELDSKTQTSILETISTLTDITVLLVTHDPRVLAYCDNKKELSPVPHSSTGHSLLLT